MVTPVTNGLPDRFTVSPAAKCDKNYLYSAKMKISPLNM
ncbi:transcriptional regulator [Escherichia coli]